MFPVFATLLMILKSVLRCHCHIAKQPREVCREFGKQETRNADFPVGLNGVRHSVYPGFKDKPFFVSSFFAMFFDRMMLFHDIVLSEFRLLQSQIDPKNFAANSPYILFELIRLIPTGAKRHPQGVYSCAANLFFQSVVPLDGLRLFFCVHTESPGNILA